MPHLRHSLTVAKVGFPRSTNPKEPHEPDPRLPPPPHRRPPRGSPALRGEPFCFHHHTARKPMPKRADSTNPRILLTPQLPAPDDFPAIQRALGEVLRLLGNDRIPESRALALLKGLGIASANLARQHRREEKLAAQGLLPAPVTDFVNDPKHGTLAPDPTPGAGCPTFATALPSLRWAGEADPIPVFNPRPQPHPPATTREK